MAWEIALVIFLLSSTVLVYLSIPAVLKFIASLKKINKTLDIVNKDLPEIMTNVRDISNSINTTSEKVESAVNDIVEIEQLFSREIKEPLQNIAQAIGMVLQLVNKLFNRRAGK